MKQKLIQLIKCRDPFGVLYVYWLPTAGLYGMFAEVSGVDTVRR